MRRLAGLGRSRLIGLVLLASSAGCVYYNTFFLAKKYYNEGVKDQEKSGSDRPTPSAQAKFDMAIKQCDKVITDYPKSKWVDDASYYKAASLYGKGDYNGAIRKLDEFQTQFPKSPWIPDARFTEGLARYQRKEYVEADSIFTACDRDYPNFQRRWDLYFAAGENQFEMKNYVEAAAWYGRAVKVAKGRRQRGDALRRDGDAWQARDRPDTAVVLYTECLKVEERGTQRLDVALSKADAYEQMGKDQEALDFLEEWKVYAANANRLGELELKMYECMTDLGRVQEAISGYQHLVSAYPNTPVAQEAQFQIGYLYETKLHDYDEAGREYEKLRNQPSSQFASQASRRAQNLATLKRFQEALASDTTQARSRAAFQLAEFYYFQMEKTDSAIAQYYLVEREFPRSVYAPKSAYARLWIMAHDRNDTLGTMMLTDSIARDYRGTRYAESALYFWKIWSGRTDERTVLLDSLLANPDTSRMAEFEPEPPPSAADSIAAPPSVGYIMTHADSVRQDSMRVLAERLRKEHGLRGPQPSASPEGAFGPTPPPPGGAAAGGSIVLPPPPPPTAASPDTGALDTLQLPVATPRR
jgi:TolA-binding protein